MTLRTAPAAAPGRGPGPTRGPRLGASRCAPVLCVALAFVASLGCGLFLPGGTREERARLERAGEPFAVPHEVRPLPPLSEAAALDDVLAHAFRSNAELEMAYFEWAAALARVPQAVSLPDPVLSYEYLFSAEKMRRWDRTTLGVAQMIPYPGKLTRAGEIALSESVAAGRRLEDRKFTLQAEVVAAWYELWVVDRGVEIDEANLELLRQVVTVTRQLVAVGLAPQADASKLDLELSAAENQLLTRRAQRMPALAELNSMLSRPVDAPLRAAAPSPSAPLPPDDRLLALVAERNPELTALAAEAQGRESAVELARLAYVPDLELSFEVEGSMERMLMGAITLPLQVPRIRAGIEESQAMLRAAQAALRSRRNELGARTALQLFLARDSERQLALFREVLLPRANDVLAATQTGYATGASSFLEFLDAQRSLLELERMQAELEAVHAAAVAELEALAALDFGTLAPAGTAP
jgi:cobalt-zinc-cadmium efflux system outer membrane protein